MRWLLILPLLTLLATPGVAARVPLGVIPGSADPTVTKERLQDFSERARSDGADFLWWYASANDIKRPRAPGTQRALSLVTKGPTVLLIRVTSGGPALGDLSRYPAFMDPQFPAALAEEIRALIAEFPDIIYVVIGNESNPWWKVASEAQKNQFVAIVRETMAAVLGERPSVKVGISVAYSVAEEATIADMYRRSMPDFMSYNGYGSGPGWLWLGPDAGIQVLERLRAHATSLGASLAIGELGYGSAESLNSSLSEQAEFFRLARAWCQSSVVLFCNAFIGLDGRDCKLSAQMLGGGESPSENMKTYLCTAGQATPEGVPKPAWYAWLRGELLSPSPPTLIGAP